jgi:hypothetical protein
MSKDKGMKNVKKAPATGGKKAVSDYQAGKNTTSRDAVNTTNKGK